MNKSCFKCKQEFEITASDLESSPYLFSSQTMDGEYTCPGCYANLWDKGFTASMEYSDDMFIREKNELLNDAEEYTEEIIKHMTLLIKIYGPGSWNCSQCGAVKLEEAEARKLSEPDRIINQVREPCNQCGVTGHISYIY